MFCEGLCMQAGGAPSLQPSFLQYLPLGNAIYMLKQEGQSLQVLFTLLLVAVCPISTPPALSYTSPLVCLSCAIVCVGVQALFILCQLPALIPVKHSLNRDTAVTGGCTGDKPCRKSTHPRGDHYIFFDDMILGGKMLEVKRARQKTQSSGFQAYMSWQGNKAKAVILKFHNDSYLPHFIPVCTVEVSYNLKATASKKAMLLKRFSILTVMFQ